jgi:signal peptidase I
MNLDDFVRGLKGKAVLATVISAGIGLIAGKTLLGTSVEVRGTSMAPTLTSGMVLRTEQVKGGQARGDIVVLKDNDQETAIKRIIGLPGETICIQHGYIFVNGTILVEPYIPLGEYTFPVNQQSVFILGPDQCFVLGDNRSHSIDSRTYGPISLAQLKRSVPQPPNQPRPRLGPWRIQLYDELNRKP